MRPFFWHQPLCRPITCFFFTIGFPLLGSLIVVVVSNNFSCLTCESDKEIFILGSDPLFPHIVVFVFFLVIDLRRGIARKVGNLFKLFFGFAGAGIYPCHGSVLEEKVGHSWGTTVVNVVPDIPEAAGIVSHIPSFVLLPSCERHEKARHQKKCFWL